jgi:glycosyltransferase involved in cell wall biosynthesis
MPGLESFLPDIVHSLEENYSVQTCYSKDMNEIKDVVEWCDSVWLEWANELAIHITNELPIEDKQVIIRLHSYEALSGYCTQIKWEKVDGLILVAQHIKDILKNQNIILPADLRTYIIPNGVDCDKFRRVVNG